MAGGKPAAAPPGGSQHAGQDVLASTGPPGSGLPLHIPWPQGLALRRMGEKGSSGGGSGGGGSKGSKSAGGGGGGGGGDGDGGFYRCAIIVGAQGPASQSCHCATDAVEGTVGCRWRVCVLRRSGTDVVTLTDSNFSDEVTGSSDLWLVEVRRGADGVQRKEWTTTALVARAGPHQERP